jgi:deoxyribose-phosphate aldolase
MRQIVGDAIGVKAAGGVCSHDAMLAVLEPVPIGSPPPPPIR